ncbi:MBL fold metallo-hydrolase [Agromyces sp. LHK192]|uniref:MBL fold metallo-hydrolase n=1 Tax=Agromyces sp. LHK192 TaxID=2498704 RepID=UPI000FD92B03|nr:MBL fold metallo-hydrolase [Agromyces sp. LHK192]
MRLTKLEHATLVLEKPGGAVVIDPGKFTGEFDAPDELVAIVITHEHDDHWTPGHLARLADAAPDARVLGPEGVVRAAAAQGLVVEAVAPGDEIDAGPFRLRFFGGGHAVIHASIPVIDNLGVVVDETFVYAGDSFSVPDVEDVAVLAVPANAPWMKIAESIDFVLEVSPRRAFGTHDALLSQPGKDLAHSRLGWATEQGGGTYLPLAAGDSIEL